MSGRIRWALLLGIVLALTACQEGGEAAPPSTQPTTTSQAESSYVVERCPELPRATPRADGLPALELPCLGGGPRVRLSDLRGVPTVVNVWAAWCTNCEREMPLLERAVRRAGDRVRFFGVHYKAEEAYGLRSAADFGVPFPSVHDADGDRVVRRLGAYAPPQTYFVTAAGRVTGREVGEITSMRELSALTERYLGVRL